MRIRQKSVIGEGKNEKVHSVCVRSEDGPVIAEHGGKGFEEAESSSFLSKKKEILCYLLDSGSLPLDVRLQKHISIYICRTVSPCASEWINCCSVQAGPRLPLFRVQQWQCSVDIFPLRSWGATSPGEGTLGRKGTVSASKAGPQCTSLGRSVVLLEKASRMPAVQHFVWSAKIRNILGVGCTLKAICDTVLSPFCFFLPHLFQDTQVLWRQSNI